MTKLEFISAYLKYLLKWNTTWSLKSISNEIEDELKNGNSKYSNNINELINIAQFEYEDTCKMTKEHVMSMEEIFSILQSNHRDKIIKEILNDK